MDSPPDHDYIVNMLPYADSVNPHCLEDNLAGKLQCLKYSFVITNALEIIERIFEHNIISGVSKRYVSTEKVLNNKKKLKKKSTFANSANIITNSGTLLCAIADKTTQACNS